MGALPGILLLLPSNNVQHDLQHSSPITFPKEENLGNKKGHPHAPSLPPFCGNTIVAFSQPTPFICRPCLLLPSHYVPFLNPKLHPSSIPTQQHKVWMGALLLFLISNSYTRLINPFRTAVPFWGQVSQTPSKLSPQRDCGPRRLNRPDHRGKFLGMNMQ